MAGIKELPKPRKPKGFGRIKRHKIATPPRIKDEAPTADMTDREKRAYYALCGDEEERREIVMRLRSLLEEEPAVTLPEVIAYRYLEMKKITFDYQSSIHGGRAELGGAVVDFMVDAGGFAIAILVNGDYWHSKPEQRARDFETKETVPGNLWQGLLVAAVIEVWESRLLACERDEVMRRALLGEELGQLL